MMCAFMTPVLRNDWEVYNTKRNRNCSGSSQNSQSQKSLTKHHRSQSENLRRRAMLERSMSYNVETSRADSDFSHLRPPTRSCLSTRTSCNASRGSFSPDNSGVTSPTKSRRSKLNENSKNSSSSSLSKFHNKVMDKLRNVLHMNDDNPETVENPEGDVDGVGSQP